MIENFLASSTNAPTHYRAWLIRIIRGLLL